MGLADIVLYTVWFLFPAFYLFMMLYASLEKVSGKAVREDTGDHFRQGMFFLVCVIVSVLIDRNFLQVLVSEIFFDFLPLGFFRIILFPVVLTLLGAVIGPSKTIRVSKAQRMGELPAKGPASKGKRKKR